MRDSPGEACFFKCWGAEGADADGRRSADQDLAQVPSAASQVALQHSKTLMRRAVLA